MAVITKQKATWESLNPILDIDDYGVESETGHYKIGDGSNWNEIITYHGIVGGLFGELFLQTESGGLTQQQAEGLI